MSPSASRRLWLALVLALFCAPLFVGLGAGDLQTDEAIYSFAAARVVESGEWLIPASSPREDMPFLEKPPLKFWIVALPIRAGLLQLDEFGLRFWDALFGALAFGYVFAIGRRLAGPFCGAVAVLILFVHGPLLFEHGLRSNNMEAALVLSYCGAVYHFLAWAADDRRARRQLHALAVALLFVLGFMTKFVAVLFLPLVLASVALASTAVGRRAARDWWIWLVSGLAALALIAPWFLYARSLFGRQLWRVMLGQHVYTRFTSYLDESHLNPWHYYLSTAWLALQESHVLLPVLVLAGITLVAGKTIRDRWIEGLTVLLWLVLPLSLISFGTSKIYHYAYPFLPPVALAAAYAIDMLAQWVRKPVERLETTADATIARHLTRWPDVLKRPAVRAFLLASAALLGIAAVATAILGNIRVRLGDLLVLRNSSVVRPALLAAALAVLANRAGLVIRVTGALLVLTILPARAYERTLRELPSAESPLRYIRDCLVRVRAEAHGEAPAAGLYVDAPNRLYHPVHYYLRRLQPWRFAANPDDAARRGAPSADEELYERLYGAERGPALVAEDRYEEFASRLQARASRSEPSVRAPAPAGGSREAAPLVYKYADVLVLLPGRSAECYPEVR